MGEVIILSEWKHKKEMKELEELTRELEVMIEHLDIKQDFYIFNGDEPIKLDIPEAIKNDIFNY
tara:strand:- start:1105 stop:1296 length:192 start_codon:yes stop_codon:yes gene_type:complete